jgi:hypothetical protein
VKRLARVGAIGALVVASAALGLAQRARATVAWDPAERVSAPNATGARFPSLAVDQEARPHLVWCESLREQQPPQPSARTRREQLYYAVRGAAGWSAPRAIAVTQQSVYQNALAVDRHDRLHLLFDYSPGSGFDVYYRQASAADGFTEGNWHRAQLLNFRWNTALSEIAVRGDTLQVVMDDAGALVGKCQACADIYFRRSTDGGETWSAPVSLRPSPAGSARPRIRVDPAGVLHVTWDEGWDHNSGAGWPAYSVYMLSPDGGESWSEPIIVKLREGGSVQLTSGSDGRGGVLLVWRSADDVSPGIYFQSSTDWGETWSEPAAIPGIMAGPYNTLDRYDLAVDGAGRIHLLAGGMTSAEQGRSALYHLEWDGTRWSTPEAVYSGAGDAQYPQLVIDAAGGVHATWHVSAAAAHGSSALQVWYARGRLVDAPPPASLPAPILARALAPASTPAPHPQTSEMRDLVSVDVPRVKTLLMSLAIGLVVAAIAGRLERRQRTAADG